MSKFMSDNEMVKHCLMQVAPLDTDMLGDTTVDRIIGGTKYTSLEEGHFIDPAASLGLVSGVVTVAQALLATGFWMGKRVKEKRQATANEQQSVIDTVKDTLIHDKETMDLLTTRPDLLTELFGVLEEVNQLVDSEED